MHASCLWFHHAASLCFLVGAINPFTLEVIIDMYEPIWPSLVAQILYV